MAVSPVFATLVVDVLPVVAPPALVLPLLVLPEGAAGFAPDCGVVLGVGVVVGVGVAGPGVGVGSFGSIPKFV